MRRRQFLFQIAAAAQDATLVADLEKQIPKLMEETTVPGVSLAIVKGGKLLWRRGIGVQDSASGIPVDHDTIFEAASMSKPVFAYAVMKLCEKGVLDLDTPLTRYTPERFLEGDARLELITARRVLSHTSGFQNWRSEKEPLRIHFTPGDKYLYSGEGYNYLQSVVTRLTGHVNPKACGRYEGGVVVCASDIETYMKSNVFAPFRMASSGYVWKGAFEKRMARPHDREGKPLVKKKTTATDAARYGSSGALFTTPTDYARFLIEVIDPKPSDRFRLNLASVKEMLRPQVQVESNDEYSIAWALGWRIAHTKNGDLFSHGGDNTGFHSIAEASMARKAAFVIMTNSDNGPELLKRLAPAVSRRLS
jgi:CubicO group peptidase (beta-lactamase class C family)